jgi:hypothetical protein
VFAAVLVALAGCGSTDSLNPDGSSAIGLDSTSAIQEDTPIADGSGDQTDSAAAQAVPTDGTVLASSSFAGGIPFGTTYQPLGTIGGLYNGVLDVIWPGMLMDELATIRARGGKLILSMVGNREYYQDADHHFSFTKWKQRIDRYKNINFSSYVNDGTIIANFLIDEPNDPTNWGGRPVSSAQVEELAKYSKQLWPNLPTAARAEPSYLTGSHPYLDAAWAQYVYRKGDVDDYIRKHVSDAQNRGLALVVGLNMVRGGPNGSRMSASQVKSWGSTLLSSSYPCAFISYKYVSSYLSTSSMKDAMDYLRNKAENRSLRSCRGN